MARALAAAIAVALLAVSGAGGSGVQTPKRGGTVVLGAPASPLFRESACLNVMLDCSFGLSLTVAPKVLEGPFDIGPDLTWRKRLVSDVDFTRRPPFTLTYHIHPEARWSDGVPITAWDFVFTQEANRRLFPPTDWHRTKIRSVTAVDSKTVRVILRSRFAGWRGLFPGILPRHALRGEDLTKIWTDGIDNPKTGRPIGSGPFLVERWERGKQLTLVRNPRYWGSHRAYLDRLVFRLQVASADLVESFGKGELDVAWGFPPGFLAGLRQERGLRTLSTPGSSWDHFEIRLGRGGHPALKSKLVRRALAYGINRAGLVRRLVGDIVPNARVLDNVAFMAQSRYYKPNWSRYRYRPDEARRLLERAGCRRGGDGVYVCAGERLRLRFMTTGLPGGYRLPLLERVPVLLQQIGIDVIPSFVTSGALNQTLASGDWDLAYFSLPSFPDPFRKAIFGCGAEQNTTGYCQRLVTRDLDQVERILDADQQARVLNRADARLASDVPVIPVLQMPQSAAFRTTIRNFTLDLNAQLNVLWNAENWWLAR